MMDPEPPLSRQSKKQELAKGYWIPENEMIATLLILLARRGTYKGPKVNKGEKRRTVLPKILAPSYNHIGETIYRGTAIAAYKLLHCLKRYIGTAMIDCQNISLYEPEQSLSLSQDEGEQC